MLSVEFVSHGEQKKWSKKEKYWKHHSRFLNHNLQKLKEYIGTFSKECKKSFETRKEIGSLRSID